MNMKAAMMLVFLLGIKLGATDFTFISESNTDVVGFFLFTFDPETGKEYQVDTKTNGVFPWSDKVLYKQRFFVRTIGLDGTISEPSDIIEISPKSQRPSIKFTHTMSSANSVTVRRYRKVDGTTNIVVLNERPLTNALPKRLVQPVTPPPLPLPVSTNYIQFVKP